MSAEDNPFAKGNYKPSVQGGALEGLVSPEVQALLDRVAVAQEEAGGSTTGPAAASPPAPLTSEEREISATIDAAMASDNKSVALDPESAAAAALAAAGGGHDASNDAGNDTGVVQQTTPSVANDEPAPSSAAAATAAACCPPESAPYLAARADYTPLGEVVDAGGGVACYATGASASGGASATAIIVVPDVWGFNGGRVRAIADEFARALDAVVLVPMLLQPALEGGTDGDGLPPDFDIGERGDEFVPWIRGMPWSEGEHAVAPKVQAVLDYATQRGAVKIGMAGFCWGGWVVFKASAMSSAVLCGAIAHPSAHVEAQIHGGDNDAMSSAVQAPMLLLPASNDPSDYHRGGTIFSNLPAGSETHTYPDMVHGWTTRGDIATDAGVARDTQDAIDRMVKYLAAKLQQGEAPAPVVAGEGAAQAPLPAPSTAQAGVSENEQSSDVQGIAARAAEAMLREQEAAAASASASAPPTTHRTAAAPADDGADAVRQMLEAAAADPASIAVALPSDLEAAEKQRKAAEAIQRAHELLDNKEPGQSLGILDAALAEFGDTEAHPAPQSGASCQQALLAAGLYTTVRTLHANRAAVLQEMARSGGDLREWPPNATLMAAFDGAERAAGLEANALVSAGQSETGNSAATDIADLERSLRLARHDLTFNYAEALRGAARWEDAINKYLVVERALAAGTDDAALQGGMRLRAGYAKTACFVELGRFDDGLQSAASALQRAGAGAGAGVAARLNAQKAFCLLQLQRFEESLVVLDELVDAGQVAADDQERVVGWRAHAQAELGKKLVAEDHHAEALKLLDQAAAHLPTDPTVQYSRGLALSHKGELDGAAAAFGRVLTSPAGGDSFEHANDVHVALGNILLVQSAFGQAVPHFEAAAVALDAGPGAVPNGGAITVAPPTTVWLHLGLARVRTHAAASSARHAFEKALACDADNVEARTALETLNAEPDAGEADAGAVQPHPTHAEGSAKIDVARRDHTQQLAAQQQQRAAAADRVVQEQADADATNLARAIFPYERLVEADTPPGVDPSQKEQYLSDAEFEQYLGMTRDAFAKLPGWKRKKQKQAARLF